MARIKRTLLTYVLSIVTLSIYANIDTIRIAQVTLTDLGETGPDCTWNYNYLSDSIEYEVMMTWDSLKPNSFELQRFGTKYNYLVVNDSVFLVGYENNTTLITYTAPLLYTSYPINIGDSICSNFVSSGEYCHLISINQDGRRQSIVDGFGTLFLPDRRIDNVYRITNTYSITRQLFEEEQLQIIEHLWVEQNASYPLLESTIVSSIHGSDTTRSVLSFYVKSGNPPTLPRVSALNSSAEKTVHGRVDNCPLSDIQFLPNPVVDDLVIAYYLDRPSNISFSLHTNVGLIIYQSPQTNQPEGDWQQYIPMRSLPQDDYVLHIYLDGIVLSETIIKL